MKIIRGAKLINGLILARKSGVKENEEVYSNYDFITLDIGRNCDFYCSNCSRAEEKLEGGLTLEEIIKGLENPDPQPKIIIVFGGEIYSLEGVDKIFAAIGRNGHYKEIHLQTNGLIFFNRNNPKNLEKAKQRLRKDRELLFPSNSEALIRYHVSVDHLLHNKINENGRINFSTVDKNGNSQIIENIILGLHELDIKNCTIISIEYTGKRGFDDYIFEAFYKKYSEMLDKYNIRVEKSLIPGNDIFDSSNLGIWGSIGYSEVVEKHYKINKNNNGEFIFVKK